MDSIREVKWKSLSRVRLLATPWIIESMEFFRPEWQLNLKEGWALKNCYFWTVVLEKTLESPLDSREIKPVNPKGNQPWIFTERTDAETEAPLLWSPDVKSWLTGKDPDAGKDWGQENKGADRGWDSWKASSTQCTWVWASSRRWGRTGKPGVLQSIGSQRVRRNWATDQRQQQQLTPLA